MTLDRNPILGELFSVRCLLTEKVSDGPFGMGSSTIRKRDYEHLLFRTKTSDDVFVAAVPANSGPPDPRPVLLRRADFEFSRVSRDIAQAMGLEQVDEPTEEPQP